MSGKQRPPVFFENVSDKIPFNHRSLEFHGGGLSGAVWFDYNNDGLLDLLLTNGKTQKNALFRNNGDGTFTDVAEEAVSPTGWAIPGRWRPILITMGIRTSSCWVAAALSRCRSVLPINPS